ncbi:MAG: hypothetical protein JWP91_1687 [Fibrobacteres bacterium]|nr:hypothetical protein [Fibrobacterota bacterium]
MRLAMTVPLRLRLPLPTGDDWLPLGLMLISFLPFGSFAALILFSMVGMAACILQPVPYRPTANFLGMVALVAFAGLIRVFFGGTNFGLEAFYVLYLSLVVMVGILTTRKVLNLNQAAFGHFIAILMVSDLVLNMPAVAFQLATKGPGDFVQGFSGILIADALSQNRTNSIRAGFYIILCMANGDSRYRLLTRVSLVFNACVLLLATSMTTIFSAIAAAGIFLLMSLDLRKTLVFGSLGAGVAFLANTINRAVFRDTTSVFEFAASLNTRWIPKLDIYNHYFGTLIFQDPILPWLGYGIGNFGNRFAILTNYSGFSHFPMKEAISALFASPPTALNLVDRYNLESAGIIGSSIVSTPWSGVMALIGEWGILGTVLIAWVGWPWLSKFLPSRKIVSMAPLLFLFLAFNLMFECYLDYPEVIGPFVVVSACLFRLAHPKSARRDRAASSTAPA